MKDCNIPIVMTQLVDKLNTLEDLLHVDKTTLQTTADLYAAISDLKNKTIITFYEMAVELMAVDLSNHSLQVVGETWKVYFGLCNINEKVFDKFTLAQLLQEATKRSIKVLSQED